MKKIFKRLLATLSIILVIAMAILIAIPFLFKDKLLNIVKDEINKQLNAKVEFADFRLSVFHSFPDLTITMTNLTVVGVETFEKDTLLSLKTLKADLGLFSVVRGDEIELKAIDLENPHINIIVLADGKANWDIVKTEKDVETETSDTTDTDSTQLKIALQKVNFNNGSFVYDDREGDMLIKAQALSFLMSGDLTETESKLDIQANIQAFTFVMEDLTYLKKAATSFEGGLALDLDKFRFTFKENTLKINNLELGFEGWMEMPESDIDMDVRLETKKNEFKHFLSLVPGVYLAEIAGITTTGYLSLDAYAKGLYTDTALPLFGARLIIEKGMFAYPDLPERVDNIALDVEIASKDSTGEVIDIDIRKCHLEIAKNPLDANLHIGMTPDDMIVKGQITAKADFATFKKALPLDSTTLKGLLNAKVNLDGKLSDIEKERYYRFKAKGTIGLKNFEYQSKNFPKTTKIPEAKLDFSSRRAILDPFSITVGTSDLQLKGKLENYLTYLFSDGVLTGSLDMISNILDINEFLTGESAPVDSASTDTSRLTAEDIKIPADIEFELNSRLTKVHYDKLTINDLVGKIEIKESRLIMDKLHLKTLDGQMLLSGEIDTRNTMQPKVAFDFQALHLSVPESFNTFNTIERLAPVAQHVNGHVSLTLAMESLLDAHLNPVYNTLNAKGSIKTNRLGTKNSKTFQKIATVSKLDKFKEPTLSNLNLAFEVNDGNLVVQKNTMHLANYSTEVEGTQSLKGEMDFMISPQIPRSTLGESANTMIENLLKNAQDQGVEVNAGYQIRLHIFVQGMVNDPKIKVDVTEQTREAAKEAKEQLVNKAIEEADQKAQELLDNAEQEAQKIIEEADQKAQKEIDNARKEANKLIEEADQKAQKGINDAGLNPVAKKAAERLAKELKEKAKRDADALQKSAQQRADKIKQDAQKEAESKREKARREAEKLKANGQ